MAGRRVADTVRSIDILPTVLDLLGLRTSDRLAGVSVVPLMTGAKKELGLAAYSEAIYPRFHFGWSDLRALTSGRYKYIAAPRPELYDLQQDPAELHNIYTERQALGDRMNQELVALEQRTSATASAPKAAVEVDPDARARLAALGYVGTFVTALAPDRAGLADPKDKIELFNLMTQARETSRHDAESDEGLHALERVVAADPKVIDAWFMLGNEYYRRRQFAKAIEQFQRALALKPDYDLVVINMANAYRALGRDQEAMVGYRRFMELDPKNAQIRYEAAQILIDGGKLDEAQRELTPGAGARAEAGRGAQRARRARAAARRPCRRGAGDSRRDRSAAGRPARALQPRPAGRAAGRPAAGRCRVPGRDCTARQQLQGGFQPGPAVREDGRSSGAVGAVPDGHRDEPGLCRGAPVPRQAIPRPRPEPRRGRPARAARASSSIRAGEYAPLGHYVMADVFARQGRRQDAELEAGAGTGT